MTPPPEKLSLSAPLGQAAVDADDGRPALSRLQTLQIVGAQRRESDLGGGRKAQSQAGRPERLRALGRGGLRLLSVVLDQRPDPLGLSRSRQQSQRQEK